MPNPPNVEGLPVWLQATASLLFLVLTAVVALRSYANKGKEVEHQPTTIAHLTDMQPLRDLVNAVAALDITIKSQTGATVDLYRQMVVLTEAKAANTAALREFEHHTRDLTTCNDRMRDTIEELRRSFDRWRAD